MAIALRLVAISLMCMELLGCAGLRSNMRRHPLIYGAAVGATVTIVTYAATGPHSCPSTYDGRPYQGTPPCPK